MSRHDSLAARSVGEMAVDLDTIVVAFETAAWNSLASGLLSSEGISLHWVLQYTVRCITGHWASLYTAFKGLEYSK